MFRYGSGCLIKIRGDDKKEFTDIYKVNQIIEQMSLCILERTKSLLNYFGLSL